MCWADITTKCSVNRHSLFNEQKSCSNLLHSFLADSVTLKSPPFQVSWRSVSFRLHPERRRFQPPPSPVVVILAASDPTYTAVHYWRSCVSGCRKPPLEQSAARRHLSFNAVFRNRLKTYLFSRSFPS